MSRIFFNLEKLDRGERHWGSTEKLKSFLKKLSVWCVFGFGFLFFSLFQNSNLLFAQEFTVTFESGLDGCEDSYDRQSIESGQKAEDPGRAYVDSYYFLGWYTTGMDGQATNTKFDFNQPITSQTTVTAKWAAAIKDDAGNLYTHTYNNLNYYLYQIPEGGTTKNIAQLIRYNSIPDDGAITIPDTVIYGDKDYTVTEIGGGAFYDCSGLTSVNLSGCTSLTSIGNYAFEDCSNLMSVDLSGCTRLTSIGHYAFSSCSELKSVTFPASLTSIGVYAFKDCSNLMSVDLSGCTRLTSIGHYAFWGCSGLTSVTFPESLTSIGAWAFECCSGLTSVTFPENLTSIGDYAFSGCSGLTSVDLSKCKNLTSIGDFAFYGCSGLELVVVPGGDVVFGSYVFNGCGNYQTVVFEDGEGNELQTQFVFTGKKSDGTTGKPAKAKNPTDSGYIVLKTKN